MMSRIAVVACLVPLATAAADIAISPALPHALDSVRLQYTEGGTFVLDPDATRVTMADGTITVTLRHGAALSPPPPVRTNEFMLGQFPEGSYRVDVMLDQGTSTVAVGSTSFSVAPTRAGGAPLADVTDLWWNASESGWGLNVVQHASGNLFMTWFAYDPSGQAAWYVVPGGTWDAGGFTGSVYRTTGPVVGDTFDPAAVTRTLVGSARLTFDALSGDLAGITFQLGGQAVSRAITRQPY
jgi:hypothetical protein